MAEKVDQMDPDEKIVGKRQIIPQLANNRL